VPRAQNFGDDLGGQLKTRRLSLAGTCRAFPAELLFMLADDPVYLATSLDRA